jgi:hypothetical protein
MLMGKSAKNFLLSLQIGCEPALAVTLAGVRRMVAAGAFKPDEDVVGNFGIMKKSRKSKRL